MNGQGEKPRPSGRGAVTDIKQLIERLRVWSAPSKTHITSEAADALESQASEIAELREALKPFAQAMDWFERRMGNEMQFLDEDSHMIGCEITVAQLRHARAKLEGGGK